MGNENEVVYLYLDDIIPNRFQPREVFEDQALKELALSIKEHGVIQPIIVRRIGSKYEIIAGERRYKASTMVGLTKIPAIVKNMDDKESSKVALIENLQRKDLTPIEEARTYQKILDLDDLTQEDLAKTMGKSQSAVSNKLRLLSLPEEVQEALLHEEISERHARSLLNLSDPQKQVELLRRVISSRMTVRELDKEIKALQITSTPIIPNSVVSPTPVMIEKPNMIEKKQENVEFLGGINPMLKPISALESKTENVNKATNNIFMNSSDPQKNSMPDSKYPSILEPNVSPVKPQEELMGGGILSNSSQPMINESEIKIENLMSPIKSEGPGVVQDTIEILDIDSKESKPKIIPMKPKFNTAVNNVKNLAKQLTTEGYKVDIKEEDGSEYYQIIFKINKQ